MSRQAFVGLSCKFSSRWAILLGNQSTGSRTKTGVVDGTVPDEDDLQVLALVAGFGGEHAICSTHDR